MHYYIYGRTMPVCNPYFVGLLCALSTLQGRTLVGVLFCLTNLFKITYL